MRPSTSSIKHEEMRDEELRRVLSGYPAAAFLTYYLMFYQLHSI